MSEFRQLKRWVRKSPGVSRLARGTAARLRRSAAIRSAVKRIYAIDTASPAPVDVTAGRVLGGTGTESLPVTLVVVLGADGETIEATAGEVMRLQLMTAGFRPVFVTDRPVFAAFRRYGYPAELIVAEGEWDAAGYAGTWDEYARRRIGLLFETYRATASVTVGPAGLDRPARLLLNSLRPM